MRIVRLANFVGPHSGGHLAAGVISVLARPEQPRRAAARARAERYGWPAAVQAFLSIHQALARDEDVTYVNSDIGMDGGRSAIGEFTRRRA
ncbi:MAG TPA: hypothetical protein VEF71_18500 [Streptosporangiaceae bacterium]|nr:hypothetical protein [Streptosporangiaceae bacterium]